MMSARMTTAAKDQPGPGLQGMRLATSRHLGFEPAQVWAAMTQPLRLARWWGPEGHSNEFSLCDMRQGGHWVFDSIGPDRQRRANRCVVESLQTHEAWVIRHMAPSTSRLTVRLTPAHGGGTQVDWCHELDEDALDSSRRWSLMDANEQNLDRLNRELRTG